MPSRPDPLGDTEVAAVVAASLRDVPDFPQPGVVFKDITPLLAEHTAFTTVVEALASAGRDADGNVVVDKVVGMEARGFILAAPVALALGTGFVPVRKPGKLPHDTVAAEYILEYGVDALEMHADALAHGTRVLLHDDLLATGGTAKALAELAEGRGAQIAGCAFLVELAFLGGREPLAGYDVHSLISYE